MSRGRWLALFGAFGAIGFVLYRGALGGPFISDDLGYLVSNPLTASLGLENLTAVFDPRSDVKFYTANYAPLHLLLHALERQFFGDWLTGYHGVNLVPHALNATLLVACLRGSGLPDVAALGGGLFFAVHPAKVEAVAWISQPKTSASLCLALGALLAFSPAAPGTWRSPGLATASLLTKASGFFALPTAAALVWVRRGDARDWCWLGVWLAVFRSMRSPSSRLSGARLERDPKGGRGHPAEGS